MRGKTREKKRLFGDSNLEQRQGERQGERRGRESESESLRDLPARRKRSSGVVNDPRRRERKSCDLGLAGQIWRRQQQRERETDLVRPSWADRWTEIRCQILFLLFFFSHVRWVLAVGRIPRVFELYWNKQIIFFA